MAIEGRCIQGCAAIDFVLSNLLLFSDNKSDSFHTSLHGAFHRSQFRYNHPNVFYFVAAGARSPLPTHGPFKESS